MTAYSLLKERLQDVLDTLTEREQEVLTLRFGLADGYSRTLEEVGRSSTSPASASARSRPRPCARCGIPPASASWKASWRTIEEGPDSTSDNPGPLARQRRTP